MTTTTTASPSPPYTSFEVHVSKDDFKFHAAHFVAFEGYRERLHGHNYKVGVRLLGSRQVSGDGYVVDFGDIKKVTRQVCKQLNEHFLCPTLSNVLDITTTKVTTTNNENDNDSGSSVTIVCQDGSKFVFPLQDCAMLPIVHATAEELAVYLWSRILEGLNASYLTERGIHTMEVIVAEAVGQEAVFRLEIPNGDNLDDTTVVGRRPPLDVSQFVRTAQPCPSVPGTDTTNESLPTNIANKSNQQQRQEEQEQDPSSSGSTSAAAAANQKSFCCCDSCHDSFSAQLHRIAAALQETSVKELATITADDLKRMGQE
ncbi:6-pyruvoyl tetrahydrobiopterin synthase [Nitzschia inconspicua]|uniref:6-pyruvoyl tetrahydrobiopterin synthase n=1 Tax=Nitzschia inconspicua TaxID=303405 RepID=A0A9K3KCI0_9STRA|nr:6-pyruvoyl tetrahydrobiopterin synthase [Nitzschia inconspicua]